MVAKLGLIKPGRRARRRDVAVDRHFGQRCSGRIGQRLLQPREELAQRGAVLLHRGADVACILLALLRFGEGGRIDGLDHPDFRRHALASAEGDAARIDQQGGIVRHVGQRPRDDTVGCYIDILFRQLAGQFGGDLAVGDEQCRAGRRDQRVRQEDGIEIDVGAAQIE